MLIQVVHDNAENILLKTLLAHQGKSATRNVYQCRFSDLGLLPMDADSVIPHLKEHLQDRAAKLLYAADGDLFVQWDGVGRDIVRTLDELFTAYCEAQAAEFLPEDIFRHYDFHAHGEELRMECRKKLGVFQTLLPEPEFNEYALAPVALPEPEQEPDPSAVIPVQLNLSQRTTLQAQAAQRTQRELPEILIVEDQPFSRKLLVAALGKTYPCHQARNGAEALALYAAHAPDIVFLDIELPDMNGHELARLFRREDRVAYIVMVSAHRYAKDVSQAQTNQVQGFIAKPYNKQKVLACMDHYFARSFQGE